MSNEEDKSIIWKDATDAERGRLVGASFAITLNRVLQKGDMNVSYMDTTDIDYIVEHAQGFIDNWKKSAKKKIEAPGEFISAFVKSWIEEDVKARPHAGEIDPDQLDKLTSAERGWYAALETAADMMRMSINVRGEIAQILEVDEVKDAAKVDDPEYDKAFIKAYGLAVDMQAAK